MKSTARRALALLLCFLMLTSSVPVEVFATNDENPPIEGPIVADPVDPTDGNTQEEPEEPGEEPEDPDEEPGEEPEDPDTDPEKGLPGDPDEEPEEPGEEPEEPGEEPEEELPLEELPPLMALPPAGEDPVVPGSPEEVAGWIVNGYDDPDTSDHYAGSDELFLNNYSQISVLSATLEGADTVPAGSRVEYSIHYQYKAAPNWSYGYDRPQSFFNTYEDNTITLTLPEGLSLVEVKTEGYKNYTTTENTDGSHTYTFSRPEVSAASGSPFEFNIVVFTAGNGTDHGNQTYNLTNALSVETTFTVLNKRNNPATELETYTQTRTASMDPVTTYTNDVWGVEKVCTSAVRNTTNNKVTVTYAVDVGTMNGSTVEKSGSSYNRNGRDGFVKDDNGNILAFLTEDLTSAIVGGACNGESVQLESATIVKAATAGENPTPVALVEGSPIQLTGDSLKMNTVTVLSDIGEEVEVPAYTRYIITAVYQLSDDMIDNYATATSKATFTNDVDLSCTLGKDPTHPQTDSASASGEVSLPHNEPASMKVTKRLLTYAGRNETYNAATMYGAINYTLKRQDNEPFMLYTKSGSTYVALSTTPAASYTINDQTVYYMDAGVAYEVAESLSTEQSVKMEIVESSCTNLTATPNTTTRWTPTFQNEERFGTVKVYKYDDYGTPVSGAVFQIAEGLTATTDVNGLATFSKVPFGTYTLTETTVPTGYAQGTIADPTFTLNREVTNKTVTYNVTNNKTFAEIILTKKAGITEAKSQMTKVGSGFTGTFQLQRRVVGTTTWEDVDSDLYGASVSDTLSSGQIKVFAPAFSTGTTEYEYRFVESIPDGYYDPDQDPSVRTSYTEPFKLTVTGTDNVVHANNQPVNVEMFNRKLLKVTATKYFQYLDKNGAFQRDTTKTATISLYKKVGNSFVQVGDSQTAGSASAVWTDLPAYDETTGTAIQYYVSENTVAGYKLDLTGSRGTGAVTVDGKVYLPVNFTNENGTRSIYNVEQAVPVVIKKLNAYTKEPIEGSFVSVKTAGGSTVTDARSGASLARVEINEDAGIVVYVKPGYTYNVVETDFDTTKYHQINAFADEPLVADLSGITELNSGNRANAVKTLTVYNAPDPLIKINKTNADGISTVTTKKAEFTVYQKNSDGSFSPVQLDGSDLVLKGDNATSGIRLPRGDYYLAETKTPDGCLDPNLVPSEYQSRFADSVELGTVGTKQYLFFKVTVKDATWTENSSDDNVFTTDIENLANSAQVEIEKYLDGKLDKTVGNFTIQVVNKQDGIPKSVKSSASTGKAVIQSLHVYGADGNKITYTVEEILTTDQLEKYYKISDGQEFQLSISGTTGQAKTTTDTTGTTLRVYNGSYIELTGAKIYHKPWEYEWTQEEIPLEDTVVGLFKLNDAGTAWELVSTQETDENGYYDFKKLERTSSYAVVEMSCPNPNYYPEVRDANNQIVRKEYPAANTTAIPVGDLDRYSYYISEADTDTQKRPSIVELPDMVNSERWTQFVITKYLDYDKYDTENNRPRHGTSIDYKEGDDDRTYDTKLDNAIFQMLRYELPEGVHNVTLDPENWEGTGWEIFGNPVYYTGTAFDVFNSRMNGTFASGVDQEASENVVYALIELSGGASGALINPNYRYTWYSAENSGNTVTFSNIGSEYNPRHYNYRIDQQNWDDLLNSRPKPGTGATMIATVRLTKWEDNYDYDTGEPLEEYEPLPNTVFGIYLDEACTELLDTLTVGLDQATYAGAQSAIFSLSMANTQTDILGDLRVYNGETPTLYEDVSVDRLGLGTNPVVVGVKVYVKELSAPGEPGYYEMDRAVHKMYLAFADFRGTQVDEETGEIIITNPTTYNDAFFVTSPDTDEVRAEYQWENEIAQYATWTHEGESGHYGEDQFRFVNYPHQDTRVTVTKFGYTPDASTLNKTSTQLDAMGDSVNKEPLDNVTIYVMHWNETDNAWRYFDVVKKQDLPSTITAPTTACTVKTGSTGSYIFYRGLPAGRYCFYESLPSKWSGKYERAYSGSASGTSMWREFTVTDNSDPIVVTMYNPAKTELTIQKTDFAGNALNGAAFKLTKVGTSTNFTGTTANGGSVTFTNLDSGNYTLTETAAPTGYSKDYLDEYLASLPAADPAKALGSTTGAFVGNHLTLSGSTGNKDVVVSSFGLRSTTVGSTVTGALTVPDPALGSLTLTKVDENDSSKLVKSAKFEVYYHDFDSFSGTTTVSPYNKTTGWPTGWTSQGTKTTASSGTNLGKISMTDLAPGIYAFRETTPGTGYDVLKDQNGNDIVYYVVIKGGMNVTVSGLPTSATVKTVDGTSTYNVDTLFDNSDAASITAKNRVRVGMGVTKTAETGLITDPVNWEAQFDIYSSTTSTTSLGTATVTQATAGTAVPFMTGTSETKLTQGNSYYLKETMTTGASDFVIKEVVIGGETVTPVNGRYPIDASGALSISVVNTYKRGKIYFAKKDEGDLSLLPGATFCILDEDMNVISNNVTAVREGGADTGYYVGDFPLKWDDTTTDTTVHTYYVKELTPPDGYVLLDSAEPLEFTASAQANVIDWREETDPEHYITNVDGYELSIHKYANLPGADNMIAAGANDATFALYHLTDEGWVVDHSTATDANGTVSWTLIPEETYAFNETNFDHNKFVRLDSWYIGTTRQTMTPTSISVTINGQTETKDAYILTAVRQDYAYDAYNVPTLKAKITKIDVGGYPSAVVPVADFKIYELSAPLPTDRAQALTVINALTDASVVTGAPTSTSTPDGNGGTYVNWNNIDPTKNYVIVETGVGARSQHTYDTQNRMDNRVVWYVPVNATTNPDPSVTANYELKNVYGDASVTVSKAVVNNPAATSAAEVADSETNSVCNSKVSSLLTGDRNVVYEITPDVTTNNQPLSSFTLTDSGLTFTPATASTTYQITGLTLAKATQGADTFLNDVADNAVISAKVTWTDANGGTSFTTVQDVSSESAVMSNLTAPAGTVSFTVEYYCDAVRTATENLYSLCNGFELNGPLTVTAKVDTQPDGTFENPVTPITKIRNTTVAAVNYPKWSEDGKSTTPANPDPATATADVTVEGVTLPIVSISKSSAMSVELKSEMTYTITVRNDSPTEVFHNPVVMDMLPTGVRYSGSYTVGTGTAGETFTSQISSVTGSANRTFEDSDGNSHAASDAETALIFRLNGDLEPGSEVDIEFTAIVYPTTAQYGLEINNYVYLSSSASSYHIAGTNPHGYSFCLTDGQFPGTLPTEAHKLGSEAETREEAMEGVIPTYITDDYVWVANNWTTNVTTETTMNIVKAIRGDKDTGGFQSDENFIATSTRTNGDPVTGYISKGYVEYSLFMVNNTNKSIKNLVLGDAIPKYDDVLRSEWNNIMNSIEYIEFAGDVLDPSDYTLYTYTGTIRSGGNYPTETAVETGLETADTWPAQGAPSGWTEAVPGADLSGITAFIIVFDSDLELEVGDSVNVIYKTDTPNITDNDEFEDVSFKNANNQYWVNYAGTSPFNSNPVSVIMTDGNVAVGGDLWIDEDWDNTQESTGNRRDYSDYDIVTALKNSLSFSITDMRKMGSGTSGEATLPDPAPAVVGESIRTFLFTELGIAALRSGSSPYVNNELNTDALKTTDPYYYTISAELSNAAQLLKIFSLTGTGATSYQSDFPANSTGNPNTYDNNFYYNGTTENGVYYSKPFFLQYGATDMTKDIGFRMKRDLDITKLAADDASTLVPGATFSIYGPFNEGMAANGGTACKFTPIMKDNEVVGYTYDPTNGTVTELVTDAEGKIHVYGLNWWKEYVIKETTAAAGYKLQGATATAGTGTEITALSGVDAAWVLEIPGEEDVSAQDSMTVNNKRETTAEMKVQKLVDDPKGSNVQLAADQFEFALYDADGTLIDKAWNGADGWANFDAVTLDKLGTFTYTIRELEPGVDDDADENSEKIPGYTYSKAVITASVLVTWENNALKSTVTYSVSGATVDSPEITNPYIPDSVKLPLKVHKDFDVTPPTDKVFTFTLSAVTDGAPMPATTTVTVTGANTASFGDIEYTEAGVYTYQITESVPTNASTDYKGYSFDTEPKTITVTVTGVDGELVATAAVGTTATDTVTVVNPYKPLPTEAELPVKKTVEGHVRTTAKEFIFTLTGKDGAPMPTSGTTSITVPATSASAESKFGKIEFKDAGTYTYEVVENAVENDTGWTYSTATHTYVVSVEDTDSDGVLDATWVIDNDTTLTTAEFTNEFIPTPTSAQFKVEKQFSTDSFDRPSDYKQEFTFVMDNGTAPAPADGELSKVIEDEGEATFAAIQFTAAGTYTYTFTESVPDPQPKGYQYTTTSHTVVITVAEDADNPGTLKATATLDGTAVALTADGLLADSIVFTNTYKPEPASAQIPVEKTVQGITRPADKTFEFTISAKTEGAPMPANTKLNITVKPEDADGYVKGLFGAMSYTTEGDWEYTIKETVVANDTGWTYDTSENTAKVHVEDVNGQLTATVTLSGNTHTDTDGSKAILFTNSYNPDSASVLFQVEKKMTGDEVSDDHKQDFEFTLTGVNGTALPENYTNTVTIEGSGTKSFAAIPYSAPGTYEYKLVEKIADPLPKGYEYDTTEHSLVVTVADVNGTLTLSGKLDGETVDFSSGALISVLFTNKFEVEPISAEIKAEKVITGVTPEFTTDFVFNIAPKNTGDPTTEKASVTVTAPGAGASDSFGTVEFTEAGTYTYYVTETPGEADGFSYDKKQHTVDVVVKSSLGYLYVEKMIVDGTETYVATDTTPATDPVASVTATLTNPYMPKSTDVEFPVHKTITGNKPASDKEFVFTLAADEDLTPDAPLPETTTLTVKGSATGYFDPIYYSAVGEYDYVVTENKGEDHGYQYDESEMKIHVSVTDNNGKLQTSWTFTGKHYDNGSVMEFVNPYNPDDAQVKVTVTKQVNGNDRPEDWKETFRFDLSGTDVPMPTDPNDATKTQSYIEITDNGTLSFFPITFTEEGTYTYELTEAKGSNDDVYTYSGVKHTIKVEVKDGGDGKLYATVTASSTGDEVPTVTASGTVSATVQSKFTNVYTPKSAKVQLPVEKTVEGIVRPGNKTFTFTLSSEDTTAPMPTDKELEIIVTPADENDPVSGTFGEIEYTEAGEWTYTIKEKAVANDTGWIYDSTTHTVVVTVVDDEGQLTASWKVDGENKTVSDFTNTYEPGAVAAVLQAKKEVTGDEPTEDWEKDFIFDLIPAKNTNPMPKGGQTYVTIPFEGTAQFAPITYDAPGTYEYTLAERIPDPVEQGYEYDENTHSVKIVVADESGNLTVTTYLDGNKVTTTTEDGIPTVIAEFENTFTWEPTSAEVNVSKNIQYIVPENAKDFTFTITADDAEYPDPEKDSVTVTGVDTGSFGSIEFTEPGTYTYTVKELPIKEEDKDNYKGYTFDTSDHTVEIVISGEDNGGKLFVESIKCDGIESDKVTVSAENPVANGTVAVTNGYKPLETPLELPVHKTITGNERAEEKEFTFLIEVSDKNDEDLTVPMPTETSVTVVGAQSAKFAPISFTEEGTFLYDVYEMNTGEHGYTYSTVVHHVTVTVASNNGQLEANWVSDGALTADGEMQFVNPYDPDDAELDITVLKEMEGNDRPTDWKQDFTFILTPADDTVPMPIDPATETVQTSVTITDTGSKSFNTIVYPKAGTYNYTIKEDIPDPKPTGYEYDPTVHTIEVVVTDNGDGELLAKVKLDGTPVSDTAQAAVEVEAEFENSYIPEDTSIILPVAKELSGEPTPTGKDKTFTFELTAKNDEPMPAEHSTVTTVGADSTEFGEITFTKAGTYTYEVKELPVKEEEKDNYKGYTFDEAVHTYVVTVTDSEGELSATWTLDGEEKEGTATFTNKYEPEAVTLIIPVTKDIEGNDRSEDWQKTFTFTLEAVTKDAPMPDEDGNVVKIIDSGSSAFGIMSYKSAGTYEYTVTETKGDEPGYTYDEKVYHATVTVTDEDGEFKLEYALGKDEGDEVIFVNEYKPEPVTLIIPVQKSLTGAKTPTDKTFTFTLEAKTENAPMPEEATVTVTGAGSVEFGEMLFEEAGTFEYVLTEKDGGANGYTYDTAERKIIVTVTDENGKLTLKWTVNDEEVEKVEFINDYQVTPVDVVIPARKILENMTMTDGMFTFLLSTMVKTEPDGEEKEMVIAEAKNKADGSIVFPTLTFVEAGEYVFKVSEMNTGISGIQYDYSVQIVTVTVTDDDSRLRATLSTTTNPVVFVNKPKPKDYIPSTGEDPYRDTLMYALASLSMVALLGTKKKKKRHA